MTVCEAFKTSKSPLKIWVKNPDHYNCGDNAVFIQSQNTYLLI